MSYFNRTGTSISVQIQKDCGGPKKKTVKKTFDEMLHPRGADGKFTEGTGGAENAGSIHERAAKVLGWKVTDAQSMSMESLRENVRAVDPALAEEMSGGIRGGSYIKQNDGKIRADMSWLGDPPPVKAYGGKGQADPTGDLTNAAYNAENAGDANQHAQAQMYHQERASSLPQGQLQNAHMTASGFHANAAKGGDTGADARRATRQTHQLERALEGKQPTPAQAEQQRFDYEEENRSNTRARRAAEEKSFYAAAKRK
jgi:hypothetical protein